MTRLQDSNPAVDFPHGRHGALYPAVQRALALRVEDRPATVADFRRLLTADARATQRDGLPTAPDTQLQPPQANPASQPANMTLPAGPGTTILAGPAPYRYCSRDQSFWIIGLSIGMVVFWMFSVLVGAVSYDPALTLVLSTVLTFPCGAGLFWIMPAVIAHKKGRRGWLWLVYGIGLGLAALPHSILIPYLESPDKSR